MLFLPIFIDSLRILRTYLRDRAVVTHEDVDVLKQIVLGARRAKSIPQRRKNKCLRNCYSRPSSHVPKRVPENSFTQWSLASCAHAENRRHAYHAVTKH